MYQCKLCNHTASHPAFLRCQRCFSQREAMRGQSRSFTPSAPSPTPTHDDNMLTGMALGYLMTNSSPSTPSYSGGGGTFDGGGASSSYDSSSSSSSSSCDSSSSSSSDSGSSSSCSTD